MNIPEGFNPYSTVDVEIETEEYGQLTFGVYKRNPEEYYGLKGRKITVGGFYNSNRPATLGRPSLLAIDGEEVRNARYSVESRALQGTIYDVNRPKGPNHSDTVNLFLVDETYFTMVQCLFLTKEEQAQVMRPVDSGQQLQFGDRISIRGQVTLQNGLPVVLVGPNSINKLTPQQDP